jgi:hypothetical protein
MVQAALGLDASPKGAYEYSAMVPKLVLQVEV